MAEAITDLAARRDGYLREAERWAFDATDWERRAAAAILHLPEVTAERLPQDELDRLGMLPKECHLNATRYIERHPGTRMVSGWWRLPRQFVLHSVVERDGKYICVTPAPTVSDPRFRFVPDPAVVWVSKGSGFAAVRDDHLIGIGVRLFPDADVAWYRAVAARLRKGMDPDEALRLPHQSTDAA